ncbi:hypothetical protein BGZ80_000592 [Entomortierella chlamydospora]|uniref:AAA+ ATPase domain-containing protein n=1 Tax=Entomortierella chlamydospora TaxID=101097 RepID=A0A9P6MS65_9FUNG|nr:hypothetical protein BGZ80_000592 [Entomortierella chlamydospora]
MSGNDSRTRSKLLIDSDDDIDDDDDDDDELLVMPAGSQKMELQIDRTFSVPFSLTEELNQPNLDGRSESTPTPQLPDTSAANQKEVQRQHAPALDEDSLFGEDFMAQFGDDGELELETTDNRRPLFPRRITLLEATNGGHESGENEDLGLDRLSISQRHRTKSGAPAVTKKTTSTHTATSSTTIISAIPSRFNMFNRSSIGFVPPMSQESSQFEEELLEMSARQHDAMLDDLILEDELLRNEAEDLDDLLQIQYQEQELQQQQQHRGQTQLGLDGINETNKRKHPVTAASSTSALTTIDDIDQFLEQSYAVNDTSLQRSIEKSKKSRLDHASTGSLNSRGASLPVTPSLQGLSIRPRLPEAPKYDYTLPPVTGSFIKAKSVSGQTFYLPKKVRVDNTKRSFVQQLKENSQNRKPLLSIPIHRMMDELDAEIRVQKQEAINRLEYGDNDEPEIIDDVPKDVIEHLWVDKYRPKKYTDLMGDERVNREVLSWIKEWDQCVFGRKYKKFTSEYKQQQQQQQQQRFKEDPLGRPDRKVLLLTGPPGLGKTTMAHVIAKQAGYNVIEVNASDDRTGASVKGKIEAALEIQSILGSDKPNLLIIDEIDGVSSSGGEQSFIKLLVDMATVEVASKEEKSKSTGKKSKKYIKKPLMRPIICICNDQYAPVLRPLRVIAQIYQFKKPSIRSVVTRLQQICEIEQIRSDTRAFGALYEMTEGDMRSCLNTLQFIKNKSKTGALSATSTSTDRMGDGRWDSHGQGLTLETLNRATVGHKDQNKSLFSVWEELFQAPYARKARSALKVMEEDRDSLTYVSRMASMIQTNGDYEKLMQGCFENFPTMIFHDVAMSKVVECTDWLAFYDQLNSKITSNFEYEVGGYVAYTLVNFHRFFAGSVRQKIEYPRKDYESFVAHKAHESILHGMSLNLPAKSQRHFRKSNFATELLSPFLRILSPYLRPVNKQLIKPDERLVLQRLVDIMIHFQLTFVQEKTEDGQFIYRLEPSIEKLGDFSGIGLKNVLTNRYAVRQLIAQEIEVELVRRAEAVKEAKVGMFFGKGAESKDPTNSLGTSLDTVGSLSMPKNMEQDNFEKEAVDFFGRTIVQTKKGQTDRSLDRSFMVESERQMKKKTRIWYKFNEGFSNAVKAKVFISELL